MPTTAALMNRWFVNIKVDREERPDLDKIYQAAQQLITQRAGGWPLTMFLTPDDQQPFFGGTYFPKRAASRACRPSRICCERVAEYYRSQRAEIRQQNAQLARHSSSCSPPKASGDVELDALAAATARAAALEQSFDRRFGGFGARAQISASRQHRALPARCEPRALSHGRALTLTRMAEGGIYDQLGGGFSRYSVDESWMIPHFEKMLYDNAQLLGTYAAAAAATGDKLFARIAGETADWVLRDMRAPQGGFYSSLDADSRGTRGQVLRLESTPRCVRC